MRWSRLRFRAPSIVGYGPFALNDAASFAVGIEYVVCQH
jgi:hypothetical protein